MTVKEPDSLDMMSLIGDNHREAGTGSTTEIEQTSQFERWLYHLRNAPAKWRILAYLEKVRQTGELFGDYKAVGDHVTEIRFDMGPGYRVYLTRDGRKWLLLLIGGDKSSQKRDIRKAKALARKWRLGHEGD